MSNKEEVVKFTKVDVLDYLDTTIMFWRKKRDAGDEDDEMAEYYKYYIDAYQSVRTSLFGELLPCQEDGQ